MIAAVSALWLGIMTSISPCPLATNVTAISYVSRQLHDTRLVLWAGVLYTLGRTVTYVALGVLLVYSLVSAPFVSHFLQRYMNQLMGPLLILVGMVLLGLIRFHFGGPGVAGRVQSQVDRMGFWGSALLGVVFALSFCPVSAALFFGSLVPLAVKNDSSVLLPAVYGIGTALPVVVFSILIAVSASSVGKVFTGVKTLEKWGRYVTGLVFVGVGVYFSLAYIFRVIPG